MISITVAIARPIVICIFLNLTISRYAFEVDLSLRAIQSEKEKIALEANGNK